MNILKHNIYFTINGEEIMSTMTLELDKAAELSGTLAGQPLARLEKWEREEFERDGFLIIPQALDDESVRFLGGEEGHVGGSVEGLGDLALGVVVSGHCEDRNVVFDEAPDLM